MKRLLFSFVAILFAGQLVWPAAAQAQHRSGRSGTQIVVVGGFGQRGWGPWGPLGGPYGPYGPWGPWGSPYSRYYDDQYLAAAARIEVEPKQAEVYVDGAQAGIVDDFDGFFQTLTLRPGEHEITLYLDGYRTQTYRRYFSPGTTQHIKGTLEKLAAGQSSGARPAPAPPPPPPAGEQPRYPAGPPAPAAPAPAPAAPQPARFGTLSLRVAPADAQILVDGQPWTGPGGELRLSIKLSAGRHHIEVKKAGFDPYVEDILIRPDATMTLNVGLVKKQ